MSDTPTQAPPVKTLVIGESGAGKTSLLASLAAAGYRVCILDLDNGIDALRNLMTSPKSKYPPNAWSRIHYRTITEPMAIVNGTIQPAKAYVWPTTVSMLSNWKTDAEDLGKPQSWDSTTVLVVDTLTSLSDAAFNQYQLLNGKLGSTKRDFRDIGGAQQLVESLLRLLHGDNIKFNVVINCHIRYTDKAGTEPATPEDQRPQQGFPQAIGIALPRRVPSFFNSMLLAQLDGDGKRRLYTQAQASVATKNSAPLNVQPHYPIESGLADYFRAIRGKGPAE